MKFISQFQYILAIFIYHLLDILNYINKFNSFFGSSISGIIIADVFL